ncbi:hypothetical protein SDC9_120148 [bioreactor metagenome]|uniref:Uncharacterized protein n=1 Tax=bioreactor metagenome TaxID=1076179 RepID=A0A645C672_9ZZZZ
MQEVPHPSYQANSYKQYLFDMNQAVYDGELNAYACAYLHNFTRRESEPLESNFYKKLVEETPIYFRQDSDKLATFIRK